MITAWKENAMGYVMGQCPYCNNVMSMPDDSATVRCPSCQAEVSFSEAANLAGNAAQGIPTPPAPDFAIPAAGTQTAPVQPQPMATPATQIQPPVTPAYTGATSFASHPLMNTWKTNTLFTILGIVASMVLNWFFSGTSESAGFASSSMLALFSLVYIVFTIVYALKVYPSYFTDSPMIQSNEAISFLNTFAGGIIFGLLWNHNLTLKKIGISHIVYVVLIASAFVLSILAVVVFGAAMVGAIA
jgi:hypothetical protein